LGDAAKIGQGKAFKNKWLSKKGSNLVRLVDSIVDQTQLDLKQVQAEGTLQDAKVLTDLKKRKLVEKQ
jgi:phenylalanyl-tRNA synthetase alpha chain